VEINALWYNAVRICATLSERFAQPSRARELNQLADTIAKSFNEQFWNPALNCCFDVVAENFSDPAIRPNQLLAISLPFAVLSPERHAAVLERVDADLMTPFGPRTLSPREHSYSGRYAGDVVARDRAYHQGSIHPWLLGHFVAAYLRVHGRGDAAKKVAADRLGDTLVQVRTHGLGHLCELFDGDAPHRPGGAIASAPAVGELLRCYVEDVLDQQPRTITPANKPAELSVTINPTPKVRT
jgi:glycogen debranching enzyme